MFLRKIFFMSFVVVLVAVLSSCGARSSVSDEAPRADEEAASEESVVGEETVEPAVSRPAASTAREPTQNSPTSPATGSSGMVSSANPLATQAGLEILSQGGNAFDAAVAVAAALGVVEPMMSGIGGYGAIVLYDAESGETRFLDTGSRTPAALNPQVFRSYAPNYVENRCGAKAISTPGNANAWEALSRDHGELEWQRLFEPAIGLAEEGFPLSELTAEWISSEFLAFPEHARDIYGKGGVPLRAGETLVQKTWRDR
jgi:gamma-glutamyltranspeptidase/glutathione hydrolase